MGESVAVIEAPRERIGGLIKPVAPTAALLELQEATRTLVADTLQLNRDYGVIPGTDKPTLWKPGAERIGVAFGCFPRYRIIDSEFDHDRPVEWSKRSKKWSGPKGNRTFVWEEQAGKSSGLYRYVIECSLVHRATGEVIGEGVGSCSTMESKYVDRPRDCENVVLKMASKRALVAAVLNTFGLSDQFTVEEDEEEDDKPQPPADLPAIATFERRERLAELVREFGDGKGLTRAAAKNVKIAAALANDENAPASHVEEGIAMLEQMRGPTPATRGAAAAEELPFA